MTADTERLLLWIDCETTGLNERAGSLLEVGLILTGWDLEEIASWSRLVAFWGPVDDEIARMHGPAGSGLLTPDPDGKKWYTGSARDWTFTEGVVAESAALWVAEQCHGLSPIWGGRNTHFDRRWLREHMSALDDVVLHRSFDETTARLVLEAWGGVRLPKDPAGGTRHRALDDLRQSIAVARRLRSFVLRARALYKEVDDLSYSLGKMGDIRCELALALGLDGGVDWSGVTKALLVKLDGMAKARAEGERAGYQRALAVVATYMRGCEDAALKAQTDVQDLQSKLSLAKDRLDKATATADAVHDVLIDLHETENMP